MTQLPKRGKVATGFKGHTQKVMGERGEMSRQDPMSEHKTSGIQVIARAAAVMRTLGDNPKGLSLAAIANIVGLPRSTVQRIITALEEEYLVESLRPQG